MADFDTERSEEAGRASAEARIRRNTLPLWLLVPLGIFGLVALTQLRDGADDHAMRPRSADTTLVFQGRELSTAGSTAVVYPDGQMVRIGASDSGIVLYRHRTQPWAGGGGGPSTSNPIFMKTGNDTYLPFKPVGR